MNCGELLSKWVGESTKNIDAIFQEARTLNAILVFDEAEGLFGQRTANRFKISSREPVLVGFYMESYSSLVHLLTDMLMWMWVYCCTTLSTSRALLS